MDIMDDGRVENVDTGGFEDEPAISKFMREGLLDSHLFEAGLQALGKDYVPRFAVALGSATAQRIVSEPHMGTSDPSSLGAFALHIRTWNKAAANSLGENGYRLALHCLMTELARAQPAWKSSFDQESRGVSLRPTVIKAIVRALYEDSSRPSYFAGSLSEFGGRQYSKTARFERKGADPDFDPDVIVERARVNFLRAQMEACIPRPAASKAKNRV